ncbi:hypothetical protein H4R20_004676, partial [Coemansia guatemalensis]
MDEKVAGSKEAAKRSSGSASTSNFIDSSMGESEKDAKRKNSLSSADIQPVPAAATASGRRANAENEAVTSFGEPLHVSVTRGTSRFQSIQRTYSKPLS